MWIMRKKLNTFSKRLFGRKLTVCVFNWTNANTNFDRNNLFVSHTNDDLIFVTHLFPVIRHIKWFSWSSPWWFFFSSVAGTLTSISISQNTCHFSLFYYVKRLCCTVKQRKWNNNKSKRRARKLKTTVVSKETCLVLKTYLLHMLPVKTEQK